uniref:Conotoxin Im6.10 n=1 Tax=Conus imperialis TaxID=35631 RepID=CX6A_CONIM|nr:RecName: Full=Conotoxin Im6.10; AltName: Full=Conopeptide im029; Flags: Precursor [Conus imperialis]AME17687.1 conopeptide im029 [Conus imperialis]
MKTGMIICLLLIAFMDADGSPGDTLYSQKTADTDSGMKRFQKTFQKRRCVFCPKEPCCDGDQCMTAPGTGPFCG